jgi:hypothetical protein
LDEFDRRYTRTPPSGAIRRANSRGEVPANSRKSRFRCLVVVAALEGELGQAPSRRLLQQLHVPTEAQDPCYRLRRQTPRAPGSARSDAGDCGRAARRAHPPGRARSSGRERSRPQRSPSRASSCRRARLRARRPRRTSLPRSERPRGARGQLAEARRQDGLDIDDAIRELVHRDPEKHVRADPPVPAAGAPAIEPSSPHSLRSLRRTV